ncbi:biotin--[acetyl-CoA-carboxylase] ligase [Selenomonas sp. TAMA-11512]|uniref:biotin--[acetyl-CoA-carboxylase] ligase n=1 Tax=Selenomonas sp. TAMA-11512 TaxID=3095337 RepID=UPI003093931F|nr:biotin--[acetyl-CoA-carboxylase] ligase [Selenomonas sp. TAMA-11512]
MRQRILSLLKGAKDDYLSGEEIAGRLGISRTAVWKHITALKEAGFQIHSRFKKGYSLTGAPDILLLTDIEEAMAGHTVGRSIVYFDDVDSTNNVAKEFARRGGETGTVVLADGQGKGRGRLERVFYCPPGKGLWFSVILRPDFLPKDAPKCTLLAAVAVVQAMEEFGLSAGIKWPNDILAGGKKLVGILTEMHAEIDRVKDIVIGIGIDVNFQPEDFPEDVREIATSLAILKGENVDRTSFLIAVLKRLDALYAEVMRKGFGPVLEAWRKHSVTLGQEVQALSQTGEGSFTGIARDIDDDGALLIDTEDGCRRVLAGEVSLRPVTRRK